MKGEDINCFNLTTSPSEKIAGGFQQAGKKRSEAEFRAELALVLEKGDLKEVPEYQSEAWCEVKIFALIQTP